MFLLKDTGSHAMGILLDSHMTGGFWTASLPCLFLPPLLTTIPKSYPSPRPGSSFPSLKLPPTSPFPVIHPSLKTCSMYQPHNFLTSYNILESLSYLHSTRFVFCHNSFLHIGVLLPSLRGSSRQGASFMLFLYPFQYLTQV